MMRRDEPVTRTPTALVTDPGVPGDPTQECREIQARLRALAAGSRSAREIRADLQILVTTTQALLEGL